jgi:gluconate 2-dehydrogenase gamma chain
LAQAEALSGGQPWTAGQVSLPEGMTPTTTLTYFTQAEFDAVAVMAERFIPADELSMSGKDAGCATFIDRQLSGDYGKGATLYRMGRFVKGTPEQGTQSALTPAERYRQGLAAIDVYCQTHLGKPFVGLNGEQQDALLSSMEKGTVDLGSGVDVQPLFEQILQNVREGFLADPIYGGNKDMVSWKMIGFPGAQYDFRPLLDKTAEKLNIIPISLIDNKL